MVELMQGLRYWKNARNKFAVIRVHYTADEVKRTKEWMAIARAGSSEVDWQREMEINFDQQRSSRVFPGYSENINFKPLQINPHLPILRGWDFGYRHPAFVVTQVDAEDIWCIHRELLGTNIELENFIPKCLELIPKTFKVRNSDGVDEEVELKFKDYCDPAGVQKSDKSKRTSIEILKAFNIHPMYRYSKPEIRSKLIPKSTEIQGILVDESCKKLNAGFLGGYHFPEDDDGNGEDPEKDGYYEHLFDAAGYIAINAFRYKNVDKKKRRRVKYATRHYDPVTGM